MLVSDKIKLRPLRGTDVRDLHALHNDPGVRQTYMMYPLPISLAAEAEYVQGITENADQRRIFLAVTGVETDECGDEPFYGVVDLHDVNLVWGRAEFGIAIMPEHQGKGYGLESSRMILRYAFDDLRLESVFLRVLAGNDGATRLYERLGFKQAGRLRRHCYFGGEWHDCVLMDLLAGELREE